jgi:hypothetical protein
MPVIHRLKGYDIDERRDSNLPLFDIYPLEKRILKQQ